MDFERWFYTVPLRLRSLFRRRRVERELGEELQYHLERQIEEYAARGLTPETHGSPPYGRSEGRAKEGRRSAAKCAASP
jgi:hypothetical protein